jgi:hypothetical protein
MLCKVLILLPLAIALFVQVFAQNNLYNLRSIDLANLSAFSNPSPNWVISGMPRAGIGDTSLYATPGSGVLLNQYTKAIEYKPETDLFSNMQHGDIYLEMEIMMAKGSNSGIYFQGRYELQLLDSWGKTRPTFSDMGGIYQRWDSLKPVSKQGFEGRAPLSNASLAPGLWQKLQVEFQSPRFNAKGQKIADARFLKVTLNGVVIHRDLILSGPTRGSAFQDEQALGPIRIQGDHGCVAFRNIRYAPLEDLRIPITDVSYRYYEAPGKDRQQYADKELLKKGNADAIDGRLADSKDDYYLRFEGNLEVPATDTYRVVMQTTGVGSLYIDDKEVIKDAWTWLGGDPLRGQVALTQGKHRFVLHLVKHVGWAPSGLGIFISKPNSKPVGIHDPASIPEIPAHPLITQPIAREPEMLRSFMVHDGKKRTHVVSVGDPSGMHYAIDLRQDALLRIWRGDFLNTTEMWYERGEPQTAEPLGAGPVFAGLSPHSTTRNEWKDSVSTADLQYLGYTLDAGRYPVFTYRLEGWAYTDEIRPVDGGKGLQRKLSPVSGQIPAGAIYRLAEGRQIQEISAGYYRLDGQYYIQANGITKFNIVRRGEMDVLTAQAQNNIPVQFTYYW